MKFILIGCAVLCLLFGCYQIVFVKHDKRKDDDTTRISKHIQDGAMAYLKQQYTVITIFCIAMIIVISFIPSLGINMAAAFIIGACFSALAGFIGMKAATAANVKTVMAAKGNITSAIKVAFSGGSILGLFVVGLGALGIGFLYWISDDVHILSGFSLGASLVALFGRVGGSIFAKAASIGVNLVSEINGICGDDLKNPAVIADKVGDNASDITGMGADLFESYVGSVILSIILGSAVYQDTGIIFALMLCGSGLIASAIGIAVTKLLRFKSISFTLDMGTYVSGIVLVGASMALSLMFFDNLTAFFATLSGIVAGILIGKATEYYTSPRFKHVKKIVHHCGSGSATSILSGLTVGMKSTVLPILIIVAAVFVSYFSIGTFGIALAAAGMLATVANIISADAYGPIADNAVGLAQMSGQKKSVCQTITTLDSVSNMTTAMGKGFSIGSAVLTALALYAEYTNIVDLSNVNALDPKVIAGVLFGAILAYFFSAHAIEAVTKSANKMVEEVRRQFRQATGILKGECVPDYSRCVDILTKATIRQMILPGALAIVLPIAVGLLLGKVALAGLFVGAAITGIPMAIQMANSGGAWDKAKKHIEDGYFGGTGSDHHTAAVVGDTIGDPMKDTAGPSINILIKLLGIVSVVFAPLFG